MGSHITYFTVLRIPSIHAINNPSSFPVPPFQSPAGYLGMQRACSTSSLCRQPQHPASPSLLFLPHSPSPDTSLQSSLGKKEPQWGQALSLTWSRWTKQRGAWVHSGPRSSDTRAFPQASTITAPHPVSAKSSYHTVTTSILQRFETDAQRGRDTTQLESAWD